MRKKRRGVFNFWRTLEYYSKKSPNYSDEEIELPAFHDPNWQPEDINHYDIDDWVLYQEYVELNDPQEQGRVKANKYQGRIQGVARQLSDRAWMYEVCLYFNLHGKIPPQTRIVEEKWLACRYKP